MSPRIPMVLAFLLTLCSLASAQPAKPPTLPPATGTQPPVSTAVDGIVTVERAGRALGLGFVLAGDGRIISALSVAGDGNQLDVRYADGSVVDVKVGHSDRVWNLVLLVPQVGRWQAGLQASAADPLAEGSRIRGFVKRGRKVSLASVVLKGRTELMGGDGALLRDAIEIATQISNADLGGPLVDEKGSVVGIVSSACKPTEGKTDTPCRPVAFGIPIDALRQFLRNAPANAIPPSPWLGIQGVGATTPLMGVRVVHAHPDSPAAALHLQDGKDGKGGDIILAVDGTPVHSVEKLVEQVRAKAVGDPIELIVLRGGKFHVLKTLLTAAPSTSSGKTIP